MRHMNSRRDTVCKNVLELSVCKACYILSIDLCQMRLRLLLETRWLLSIISMAVKYYKQTSMHTYLLCQKTVELAHLS